MSRRRAARARWLIVWAACVIGCGGHEHGEREQHGHAHSASGGHEVPSLVFTHWTEATELFVELPALRVGEESPCAAHVTVLEGFSAPSEGRVTAVLSGGSAPEERFESGAPTVPGIFRPVIVPVAPGARQLRFEIEAGGVHDVHELGEVRVYASDHEAIESAPEEEEQPGRIVFLKEQQWPIEFATDVVREGMIARSISAPATVRARDSGEAWVVAPRSGRVLASADELPRLGATIEADALLVRMTPELEGADRPSLDLEVTEARLQLERARRERERLAALFATGAVPERRALDARHEEAAAAAALSAAQRRIGQYRGVQRGGASGSSAIEVRAPIAGRIAEVRFAPGAFVEEGAPLFRIVDSSAPWMEIHVPAVDASGLDAARGGWASIDGRDRPTDLLPERFVAQAPAIDPESQTLRVVYALPEDDEAVTPGLLATAYLRVGEPISALVVPSVALVADGPATVVYVQVEGEAFERRVVRVIAREGDRVGVEGDVAPGEHVAARGAYAVRLAAASGSAPAHGHAH